MANHEITLRGYMAVTQYEDLIARSMHVDDIDYKITDEYERIDIEESCYVEIRGFIAGVNHHDYSADAGTWYTIIVAPLEIKAIEIEKEHD